MGYYTNYELKTEEKVNIETFLDFIDSIDAAYIFSDSIEELRNDLASGIKEAKIDMDTNESFKWHEHDDDMKQVSQKNHGIVFTLYGEGEEAGDLWVNYYKNGKVQHECARIIYPEFDETKLK